MTARSLRRASVGIAALTFVAAACARDSGGDGPYADLVGKYVPRIEQTVGLTFKQPPRIERRSKDEVRTFLVKQLSDSATRAQVAGQEAAYRVLGLLADTVHLAPLLQRLLEEQIVGYYDPKTKALYVVEGAPSAILEQTVSHELVHALQDQYLSIDSLQQASPGNADKQAAAQAILEGQAVFAQLRVDPNAGPMMKMPGGWDRIRDMMRESQGGMPVFASAPRVVREGLLFPYIGGADFVRRFIERRPEKDLLTDLPASTKQILNDRAYFADTPANRDAPTDVTLPPLRTGTATYANTFGEFETRLVLVQHLKDETIARNASSGLDGDRYQVVSLGGDTGLVWATVWDSPVDAADFLDALTDAMRRRYDLAKPSFPAGAATRRLDAPARGSRAARTVNLSLHQVGGRAVVVMSDAPIAAGVAPLVDGARVTLGTP